MNLELQAKFILSLNRKGAERGFTLIELLVVIVIIGILAAIAIPNFLAQSAKARQLEAKQNLSLINKSQVNARATGVGQYHTSFDRLAIGTLKSDTATSTTSNFNYSIAIDLVADKATGTATPTDVANKSYSSGILRYINSASNPVTTSIICESRTPNATPIAPIATIGSIGCDPAFIDLGSSD
jgi:type IV pilus assembly protein PilA